MSTYQKNFIYVPLISFMSTLIFPYDIILPTLHALNFLLHILHFNIISLLSQILRALIYQTDRGYNNSSYGVRRVRVQDIQISHQVCL